jgi:hypothetical protein
MGTGVVAALVEGYLFSLFPGEEGVLAVGAVILCLILAESFLLLKELAADLAEELGSLLAVVVVEVGMRGLAGRAASAFRDPRGAGPVFLLEIRVFHAPSHRRPADRANPETV